MIRIQKGESKLVIFTLKEKSVLTNPNYIFEFNSNDNRFSTYITATNSSISDRYDSFTFSEGVTATFSGGFNLDPGQYDYKVWETPNSSTIDTSTASVVEIGLMEVIGTASIYNEYTSTDDDREYTYIS